MLKIVIQKVEHLTWYFLWNGEKFSSCSL